MKDNFIAIHHVSVIVANVERALDFYCDVLGLEKDESRPDFNFNGAWIKVNSEQQIHLLQVPNPDTSERPEHGGRDRHTAFRVRDLNFIQDALDANDIPYTKSQSGRSALFCRDPDGNTLEIMQ